MPIIVVSEPNWADEFNMYGFRLYESEEDFEENLAYWKKCVIKQWEKENKEHIDKLQEEERVFNEWWEQQKIEFNLEDKEYWMHANQLYKEGKPYIDKPYNRLPDFEFGFGTNESFYFSRNDIENIGTQFKKIDISQATYEELQRKFHGGGFWLLDCGCWDYDEEED